MSKWIFIGSVAQRHWFPDARAPIDIDVLTPATIKTSSTQVCFVDASWHEVAEELIAASEDKTFLDPNLLFTLKVSHAHWDIKWDKTMFDVAFLAARGCTLHLDLYTKLFKVWERVHGSKRVNMAQHMSGFFDDAVKREHDHERLHELVAFNVRPWHESIRPDLSTAWVSREMFEALKPEQQLEVAMEEAMVFAIERGHLTSASKNSEKIIAFSRGYKTLCTSATTGWFARFLILNHRRIMKERLWLPKLNSALTTLSS